MKCKAMFRKQNLMLSMSCKICTTSIALGEFDYHKTEEGSIIMKNNTLLPCVLYYCLWLNIWEMFKQGMKNATQKSECAFI